ncbi:MAG: hypothetical protein K2W82_05485 [Candidatus Obscuribacterales bacterium]|nr:hypothetical protein [Candidatus Obscuribacterales bacterium]
MSKLTVIQRLLCSTLMLASTAAPALALDYEAKPVSWCLQAPFRLVGGLTGAVVNGGFSGPVDDGYHWSLKGTKHVAGKFGDEKGAGQLAAAAPLGGSVGAVLGGGYGVLDGVNQGFRKGWNKPFSRWSYITMEEK